MASSISLRTLAAFLFAIALFVQGTLGGIECEQLGEDRCAFAVSSTGKRCLLEKRVKRTGEEAYTCKTSEIEADNLRDHIETDECVKACGLDRNSLGISSDSLLETHFTHDLCSPHCYNTCPNVVDLYYNLAAAEGLFLPKLCEAEGGNARREMAELRSPRIVAPGPSNFVKFTASPPEPGFSVNLVAESQNIAPAPY